MLQAIRGGRHESAGGRVRFSDGAREAAIRQVQQRRVEGITLKAAAREVGVGYETLRRWLAERQTFRPVRVTRAPEVPPTGMVVVLPGEVRVEGLDVELVAELARLLRCFRAR